MKPSTAIMAAVSLVAISTMAATAQPGSPPSQAKKGLAHSHMAMANGPHHVLAMAYHENMLTFVRVVQNHTTSTVPVDVDFTRAAVDEMQRSLDEMKKHHQEHMKTMSAEMRTASVGMVQEMETQQSGLTTQLNAMEEELNVSIPDAKKLSKLADSIHAHLAAMSKMKPDMTMKM